MGYTSSDDYLLHSTEHSALTSVSSGYATLFHVGIIVPNSFNKFINNIFLLIWVSALSIVQNIKIKGNHMIAHLFTA